MLNPKSTIQNFNKTTPFIITNFLSDDEVNNLRSIIEFNRNNDWQKNDPSSPYPPKYKPQIFPDMSRCFIEFDMPKYLTEKTKSIVKEIYPENLRLAHNVYIEYNKKYGDGNNPSLEPHFDIDNNIVTIDYILDNEINWGLNVEGEMYYPKTNDAIVFSPINQIHWRPKRDFVDGEICEVITMNYTPIDDWKFTTGDNPLDPIKYPSQRSEYLKSLNNREDMISFYKMYQEGR